MQPAARAQRQRAALHISASGSNVVAFFDGTREDNALALPRAGDVGEARTFAAAAQASLDAWRDTFGPALVATLAAWLLGGVLYRVLPVTETVGGHIRNLLMVQACLCVAAGAQGLLPACLLVLLSFVFPRLSKRFYSS